MLGRENQVPTRTSSSIGRQSHAQTPAHMHIRDVLHRHDRVCVLHRHCVTVIEEATVLVGMKHGRSWKGRGAGVM